MQLILTRDSEMLDFTLELYCKDPETTTTIHTFRQMNGEGFRLLHTASLHAEEISRTLDMNSLKTIFAEMDRLPVQQIIDEYGSEKATHYYLLRTPLLRESLDLFDVTYVLLNWDSGMLEETILTDEDLWDDLYVRAFFDGYEYYSLLEVVPHEDYQGNEVGMISGENSRYHAGTGLIIVPVEPSIDKLVHSTAAEYPL